jgi:hypothetical protein
LGRPTCPTWKADEWNSSKTLSSRGELAEMGMRVQAVLSRATATDFWDIGGLPLHGSQPRS